MPAGEARRAAAAVLPDRIAFLGFGLIGGSIAMALRASGYAGSLVAWTPGGRGPGEARRRRIVDEVAGTGEEALAGAALVVLAGPPMAVLDAVSGTSGPPLATLGEEVTITDVASTKRRIVDAAANQRHLHFVGGHPMAGRETTGVESATADLFLGRPWVVVPGDDPRGTDIDTVWSLALATGADPVLLGAELHDRAVAAISHVPLVVAAALVESVAAGAANPRDWATAKRLAATGWRDMSRLAKGDPVMGAGILATNADAVRDGLMALRATLDGWIEQLGGAAPDPEPIRSRLQQARGALEPDTPT